MAPPHTIDRITYPVGLDIASSVNGVYVPAMNRKIIEWSARFIHLYARGLHRRRWYSALTPNNPSTVRPYTDVARVAIGDTVAAAMLISAAVAARAPKNVQKWMCPRRRGRGSTRGRGSVVELTVPGYGAVGARQRSSHAPHTGCVLFLDVSVRSFLSDVVYS